VLLHKEYGGTGQKLAVFYKANLKGLKAFWGDILL
jgi:hypothetical protein